MKYIITESQFENKVYGKFLDMLVDKTELFGGKKFKYNKYGYSAHIRFPYSDNSYDLAFNSPSEYTFTSPPRYGLKDWFLFIGVDMDEDYKSGEKLWNLYLDRLEIKVKEYIKNFLDK